MNKDFYRIKDLRKTPDKIGFYLCLHLHWRAAQVSTFTPHWRTAQVSLVKTGFA